MKKILRAVGILILAIIVLATLYIVGGRLINGQRTKIISENGIQEQVTIDINGIKQELSIRGEDINNPVILFLHGGPGNPVGYFDYIWQPELNKDFTIVTYDQRGSGRTYYANPEAEVSKELILEDIDAIVSYLQDRFKQEKVIIMGHSWGTLIGTTYVYNHPDKVSSYIGIGQVVSMIPGEEVGYNEALKRAAEVGDTKYIDEFTRNYESFLKELKVNDAFITYRGMEPKYLKGNREKSILQLTPAFLTSPSLKLQDVKWFLVDSNKVLTAPDNTLTNGLFKFDANEMLAYKVPMYFISGGSDYVTPFSLAETYCKNITAPDKQIIIIEGAGHNTFVDVPEEFVAAVKEVLGK